MAAFGFEMEHSQHMDHGDHGGHGGHGGHGNSTCPCGNEDGHHHPMVFHAEVCQEILFNGWLTTNALELFGSCVAIFLAGVLYEGLKYYREALHCRFTTTPGDSRVNITKTEGGTTTAPGFVRYSIMSSGHLIQTFLHLIQSTASYILMLVFMTYNVWLCMALVLGMTLGYFFFGWKKNSVVDLTEHCQ